MVSMSICMSQGFQILFGMSKFSLDFNPLLLCKAYIAMQILVNGDLSTQKTYLS